jgi:hypothetical protein
MKNSLNKSNVTLRIAQKNELNKFKTDLHQSSFGLLKHIKTLSEYSSNSDSTKSGIGKSQNEI